MFQAILIFIRSNEIFISPKLLEVINDFSFFIIDINRGIKFDNIRNSASNFTLDVCLDTVYVSPFRIILSFIEGIHKSNFRNHLNIFVLESDKSHISVEY